MDAASCSTRSICGERGDLQLISERGLKLATDPKVTLSEEEGVVEKVIQANPTSPTK